MIAFSNVYGVEYKGYKEGFDPVTGEQLYRVESVPAFSECFDDRYEVPWHYDRKWLDDCTEYLNDLQTKNHYKPIHFDHHKNDTQNLEQKGIMLDYYVDDLDGFGKTIFCDLARVPEPVFQDMQRGVIAQRSVEIPPPHRNDPCISSMAMLSTQDPKMQYPNLYAVEISGAEDASALFSKSSGNNYIQAFFPYDKEFEPMSKKKTGKRKFQGDPVPGEPTPPDDDEGKGEGDEGGEGDAALESRVEKLEAGQEKIMGLLDEMKSMMGKKEGDKGDQPPPPAAPADSAQMSKVMARLDTLDMERKDDKVKFQKMEAKFETTEIVTTAGEWVDRFEDKGYLFSKDAFLKHYNATANDSGHKAAIKFAKGYETGLTVSPKAQKRVEYMSDTDPLLLEYKDDPVKMAKAKEYLKSHRELNIPMSEDRWVKSQFVKDGFPSKSRFVKN